jgi:hypothetical protein
MDKGKTGIIVNVLANPLRMQSERLKELEKQFRWKAENNIRFYEKLDMTTEEKVDFLAQEFAAVYWLGEMRRLDWPDCADRIKRDR